MEKTIGKITSNSLGSLGEPEIQYGYIDVLAEDGRQFHVKVDVHTFHETLNPGQNVEIEYISLGGTDILVAKAISIVGQWIPPKKQVKATA
ncbi:MAG: hypothetical protein P1Q69_08915 [Candidatus Thorarchaeota archaeon]|nr:hypothetical protein [Candidatus Thorarchaeota archaeon]